MMITPHNYLASGPGLQSNQAIKIKTNVSFDDNFLPILGKPTVTSMGGESLNCTLDLVRTSSGHEISAYPHY